MRWMMLFSVLLILASCKKKQREGTYSGVEELHVQTENDTIISTFNETSTVQYQAGGKVEYASSTYSFIVGREDKNKEGYHYDSGAESFSMVFKDDSLIATYFKDWLGEQTTRTFRGKK